MTIFRQPRRVYHGWSSQLFGLRLERHHIRRFPAFGLGTASAEPAYEFDPVIDGGLLATTAAISLVERKLLPRDSTVSPMCSLTPDGLCDPADLHPLDAAVVGRWNEDWALATDVALVGSMTLPYAILALDSLRIKDGQGFRSFAVDSAIVMESYLISNVAVVTLKYAMRRPRPTQYTNQAPAELFGQLEHQLSFPSGHSAAVASAMSATTLTYWLRHPESPGRWALLASSVGMTSLTAVGRVQAGKHFPDKSPVFGCAIASSFHGCTGCEAPTICQLGSWWRSHASQR